MDTVNIFCFGFGQVAKHFIKKLHDDGISFVLSSTSREESKIKKFENINYESFNLTEQNFDKNLLAKLENADHILLSIAPINGVDIVLKNFQNNFKPNKIKWMTYLSATSVYGDHGGKWVDENSITNPTFINGITRLKVEKEWIKFSNEFDLPIQIFRLSGIYSNQYNVLRRLKLGEAKIVNKVHVEHAFEQLLNNFKKMKFIYF